MLHMKGLIPELRLRLRSHAFAILAVLTSAVSCRERRRAHTLSAGRSATRP